MSWPKKSGPDDHAVFVEPGRDHLRGLVDVGGGNGESLDHLGPDGFLLHLGEAIEETLAAMGDEGDDHLAVEIVVAEEREDRRGDRAVPVGVPKEDDVVMLKAVRAVVDEGDRPVVVLLPAAGIGLFVSVGIGDDGLDLEEVRFEAFGLEGLREGDRGFLRVAFALEVHDAVVDEILSAVGEICDQDVHVVAPKTGIILPRLVPHA